MDSLAPVIDLKANELGGTPFLNYDYWASTEGITDPINNAWLVNFGNNTSNDNYPKTTLSRVRAIRKVNGCDSTAILNLTIAVYGCTDPTALNYDPVAAVDDESCTYCENDTSYTYITSCDSVLWNGNWYNTSGTYDTTFSNSSGYVISPSANEGNNWCFGWSAGLDFNGGTPVAAICSLSTEEGCSSISDTAGNLLFYTDGTIVWDKNHTAMLNGYGLTGHYSSTQSAIIIKKPGSTTNYYIFTLDGIGSGFSITWDGMYFSEVDMTLNGGLGDVVASNKNTPVVSHTAEKVAAIKHQNGTDFWIVVRLEDFNIQNSNTYHAYLLTSSGLNMTPIVSNVGPYYFHTLGYLKASPDGNKIAAANSRFVGVSAANVTSDVNLFDFDNSSGILSNPMTFDFPFNGNNGNVPYGVEFSPNSNILYVSSSESPNKLTQFDLLAGSGALIDSSRITISVLSTGGGALQIGPDGKIYTAQWNEYNLGVINNPNVLGSGCNYNPTAISVANGTMSQGGLPAYYNSMFVSPQSTCDSTAILYLTINTPTTSITNAAACGSYTWNGQTYTTSGTYIWLGTNANGCDSTATLNLTINNGTTAIIVDSSCAEYIWNGSTYSSSGTYTWIGTNAAGCDSTVTLYLTVSIPTSSTTNESACDSYTWNGSTYNSSGTYIYNTINANGCDSIATLSLTINSTDSSFTYITSCDSAEWNGTWYYNDTIIIETGLTTTIVGSSSSNNKEENIWYFGDNAGLDFNSGSPVALSDGQISTGEGCATISDDNGDLLFYTDGSFVYNKNHTLMPNGTGLLGNHSSTQSAIIIKKPGSTDIYYIFTADGTTSRNCGDEGLNYSEVDMSHNGGLGNINSNKNILLIPSTCEKVTAIEHQNGSDFWIISRVENSNSYHSYLLSSTGLNTTPIITNIGPIYSNSGGYLKGSHDGTQVVAANSFVIGDIELYDFDNANGTLSNMISINLGNTVDANYGVEFSPNNEVLYISDGNSLFQLDLTAGSQNLIENSVLNLASGWYYSLELAPDGKIYIAIHQHDYLAVINDPNILGLGCNFTGNGVNLANGTQSYLGLPTFFSSNSSGCDSVATAIIMINTPTTSTTNESVCDSYTWNGITYTGSGTYTYSTTNANGCDSTATLNLTINNCAIFGCTDSTALNFNPLATIDDSSCIYNILGCTDSLAINYDPTATLDDGSCTYCDITMINSIASDPLFPEI